MPTPASAIQQASSIRAPSEAASSERPSTRPPVVRLDSLKNPQPRTIRFPRDGLKEIVPHCNNDLCAKSDMTNDGGKIICRTCGYVVEGLDLTSELTFGDGPGGLTQLWGTTISNNDDKARAAKGPRFMGGLDSRQVTERAGSTLIGEMISALNLSNSYKERAMNCFKLAANHNFIQGRMTTHVAAACLYVACRQDKENRIMLLDLSEHIKINVFKLGKIFTTLVDVLHLELTAVHPVDPENLIQRFAQELEFGVDEHRIAKEALTILSRMNRDWMVSGRRPAGVCGAAIILAARMNNYRRTVREVVYTAKIGDATIQKRLDEFMVTESSGLTVTEFKHHGKDLEKEHDPPSYYRQFESKPKRRKRKRKEADEEDEEINDDERDGTPAPTERGGSATPEPRAARGKKRQKQVENAPQKTQTDSEIMPPPPIPIDPTLLQEPSTTEAGTSGSSELVKGPKRKRGASSDETEESTSARQTQEPEPKRKRGRPAGSKNKPLPELDEEMIRDEEAIEEEINHLLEDSDFVDTAEIVHREQSVTNNISDNPEIDPTEFEDDREVANCLLTEAEIRSKELLWVNLNSDWLRKQQKRRIRDELAKKAGTTPVVQTRKRRRARMGDMSQYVDQNGNQIVFKDAKEATAAMMAKRGFRPPVISKKINYDKTKTGGYFSLTENLLPPRPPRRSKKTNSTETSRSGSAKATTPSVSGRKEAVSITSSPISSPLSTPSRTPTPDLTPRSSRAARASTPAATKAKATRSAFAPRGTSGSSRASSRASTPAAREPSQPPSTAGKAKATTKATKKAENELASFVKEGWVSHSDDEVEEEEEEEEDYEETEEDSEARYQEEFDAYGGEEV